MATSLSRTIEPSSLRRTMISSNSAAFSSRPLTRDRELERLPRRHRLAADLAGGGLEVLLLDRLDDLGRRDLHVRQAVRVEPDPHRVLAAEDVDVADARRSACRTSAT